MESATLDRMDASAQAVVTATKRWLELAVIGLDLCPFARAIHLEDRIRYAVTDAATTECLLEALVGELRTLAAADASQIETTLLIHPGVLADFLEYNDFLATADAALARLGLTGEIQ